MKGNDHSILEAYDHFLPKGKYPFNSINFRNLAPMCHECNSSYKLEQNPLLNIDPISKVVVRRKAFYPYSSESWKLNIQITLHNSDLNTLTKDEIEVNINSFGKNEEIESWMEVFEIEERYRAKLLGKSGKYWYTKLIEGYKNASQLSNGVITKDKMVSDANSRMPVR